MSNKSVAQLLHLHEHTVKDLDTRYMQARMAKTPQPAPQVIGIAAYCTPRNKVTLGFVEGLE